MELRLSKCMLGSHPSPSWLKMRGGKINSKRPHCRGIQFLHFKIISGVTTFICVYREEINVIRQTCYFRTINMSSFMIFVRLALAIILLVWVLKQNIVTPEIAFLTLSWYNITRLSLVMFVPNAFTFVAEALKSISRIEVSRFN